MINVKQNGAGSLFTAPCTQPLTSSPKDGLGLSHAFRGRIAYAEAMHCYKNPNVLVVHRKRRHIDLVTFLEVATTTPAAW